jgi:hypothetical protein
MARCASPWKLLLMGARQESRVRSAIAAVVLAIAACGGSPSLAGKQCDSAGRETCDGAGAVAVCDNASSCSVDEPCSDLAWRDLPCAGAHTCMTHPSTGDFGGAMCLPDVTDRTCVADPALSSDGAMFATTADLNGDGAPDVVASNQADTWVELSGATGFTRTSIGPSGGPVWLGDVNGDGVLDAVATGTPVGSTQPGVTVAVAKGLGQGVFGPFVSMVVSADEKVTGAIALADVDGDRLADLVVGVQRVGPGATFVSSPPTLALRLYRGSPTGLVATAVESTLTPADTACKVNDNLVWDWVTATGDFDGDGTADAAIADCSGVEVALANPGKATFGAKASSGFGLPPSRGPADTRVYSLAIHDVDGDGHADLVAARSDGRLALWHGAGDGTLAGVVALAALADLPWRVFAADINGDGCTDIVAQGNSDSGGGDSTVEVLLGKPGGVGSVPHVFAPLASQGSWPRLYAVAAAPPGGKGTLVLGGTNDELQLVPGACQ